MVSIRLKIILVNKCKLIIEENVLVLLWNFKLLICKFLVKFINFVISCWYYVYVFLGKKFYYCCLYFYEEGEFNMCLRCYFDY